MPDRRPRWRPKTRLHIIRPTWAGKIRRAPLASAMCRRYVAARSISPLFADCWNATEARIHRDRNEEVVRLEGGEQSARRPFCHGAFFRSRSRASGLRGEGNATARHAVGSRRAETGRHRTRPARDLTLRTPWDDLDERAAEGRRPREADLAGEARVETVGVLRARRTQSRIRERVRRASDTLADEHGPPGTGDVDRAAPEAIAPVGRPRQTEIAATLGHRDRTGWRRRAATPRHRRQRIAPQGPVAQIVSLAGVAVELAIPPARLEITRRTAELLLVLVIGRGAVGIHRVDQPVAVVVQAVRTLGPRAGVRHRRTDPTVRGRFARVARSCVGVADVPGAAAAAVDRTDAAGIAAVTRRQRPGPASREDQCGNPDRPAGRVGHPAIVSPPARFRPRDAEPSRASEGSHSP